MKNTLIKASFLSLSLLISSLHGDASTVLSATPEQIELQELSAQAQEMLDTMFRGFDEKTMRLLAAIGNDEVDEVRRLISEGANVNARSEAGWTPLLVAVVSGAKESTRILANEGASVEAMVECPEHLMTEEELSAGHPVQCTIIEIARRIHKDLTTTQNPAHRSLLTQDGSTAEDQGLQEAAFEETHVLVNNLGSIIEILETARH